MQKVTSEFLGTFLLLNAIVGSGIMATNLTENVGVQLLINAIATVGMLFVIISVFGEISGAHFNPVVSLYATISKAIPPNVFLSYVAAQILGAVAGTLTANSMYRHAVMEISTNQRFSMGTFIGELIATSGLLFVIAAKAERAALLVPAWIGSAYFFTSSTSFANPAVSIGRVFTNSFAGIAPNSVIPFIAAQVIATPLVTFFASKLFKEKA